MALGPVNSQIVGRSAFVLNKGTALRYAFVDHLLLLLRITPLALGAESLASSFSVAKGNDMIALRADRERLSWHAPRGG